MNSTEKFKFKSQINSASEISRLISDLLKINSEFKHQFENKIFSVGGFVRDQYLHILSNDLDIVIESPDGAKKFSKLIHDLFKNQTSQPFQKGLGYPIWYLTFTDDITFQNQLYKTQNGSVDFADTQKECFADSKSRQRVTTFGSLNEDIRRRDFTINMLAENLTTGEILDLSKTGFNDLNQGLIRTHPENNADQVFSDDPLRILRAIRFATKYNFKIQDDIKISIQKNASRMQILSAERLWEELKKIILHGDFFDALKKISELNIAQYIFIDFKIQNLLESDFFICKNNIVLNLVIFFKNHTEAQIKQQLLSLKVENKIKNDILKVSQALLELNTTTSLSTPANDRDFLRRYIDQIEYIKSLLISTQPHLAQKILAAQSLPLQKKPKLNGHDILRIFKVSGPDIQKILTHALQIEDQLIIKYQTDFLNEALQSEVLSQLKAIYLK